MIERSNNKKSKVTSDERKVKDAARSQGQAKSITSKSGLAKILEKAKQAIGLADSDSKEAHDIKRTFNTTIKTTELIVEGMQVGEEQNVTEIIIEGINISEENKLNELIIEGLSAAEVDSSKLTLTYEETAQFLESFVATKGVVFTENLLDSVNLDETINPYNQPAIRESFTDQADLQEDLLVSPVYAIREIFIDSVNTADEFISKIAEFVQEVFTETVTVAEQFTKNNIAAIREFFTEGINPTEIFSKFVPQNIIEVFTETVDPREIFIKLVERKPDPPRSVSAFDQGGCSAVVSWTDPLSGNPDNYILEARYAGGGWNLLSSNIPGTDNSYTHNYIVDQTQIEYRMRAETDGIESDNSNISAPITSDCPGGPILQ